MLINKKYWIYGLANSRGSVEVFTSNTRPLYILFILLSTSPLIATRTLFSYLTYLVYDDPARLIFVPEG
jgi:hypothetical protein